MQHLQMHTYNGNIIVLYAYFMEHHMSVMVSQIMSKLTVLQKLVHANHKETSRVKAFYERESHGNPRIPLKRESDAWSLTMN